jgi:hypothetical protein
MTLELSGMFEALFESFGGLGDPREKLLPDSRNKDKD